MKKILELDMGSRDVLTHEAFSNAITMMHAFRGSTNPVLHLIAIVKAAEIYITVDDCACLTYPNKRQCTGPFYLTSRIGFSHRACCASTDSPAHRRPHSLANMKPSGKHMMIDLNALSSLPALLKYFLDNLNLLNGDVMSITGKILADNLRDVEAIRMGKSQGDLAPLNAPLKSTGHLTLMRGNLCTGSTISELMGKEGSYVEGPAICFNEEHLVMEAIKERRLKDGHVIIQYAGPGGMPSVSELLGPKVPIMGARLGKTAALISDGRLSAASYFFCTGHVVPEAIDGGPMALVEDGNKITIDSKVREVNLHVDQQTLTK